MPIQRFIQEVTGEMPYPGKENVALPTSDFISVDIVSADPISWTNTSSEFTSSAGYPATFTQYTLMIRVTGYGGKAFSWLHTISDGIRFQPKRETLRKNGLSYQDHTEVRDASVPIDQTKIEKRYTMVIQFGYISGYRPDPGFTADCIETVGDPTFEGTYTY